MIFSLKKKIFLKFFVNENIYFLCCDLIVFDIFIIGNLLKYYKERYVGCEFFDILVDLDRAVIKGFSIIIFFYERGMYSVESYNRDN